MFPGVRPKVHEHAAGGLADRQHPGVSTARAAAGGPQRPRPRSGDRRRHLPVIYKYTTHVYTFRMSTGSCNVVPMKL